MEWEFREETQKWGAGRGKVGTFWEKLQREAAFKMELGEQERFAQVDIEEGRLGKKRFSQKVRLGKGVGKESKHRAVWEMMTSLFWVWQ